MMGVSLAQLVDEFMWRERYGKTAGQVFNNVYADISTQYPVESCKHTIFNMEIQFKKSTEYIIQQFLLPITH